ncbi:MAG TPA: nitroreductase family protein [Acidimicrobiia bacterium]|nr:nitroreductase family protein [Acidimicrobiia bacterium]
MEFRDVIQERRMVRNYGPEPVPPEALDRIVDAGLRAPSAGNSQGLAFVIVTDQEIRRAIAVVADEEEYVAAGFDPWISRAPAHIIITVSEQVYRDRYREPDKLGADGQEVEWPVPFWWVDSGAAMMAVLLAAVDEGLAAGFLGVHSVPRLGALLGIPPHHTPIGVVTVGYPMADRRSGSLARGKRPRETVVHYERWAG